MKKLSGVTTAMLTPVDKEGKPNFSVIKQITKFLVNEGINGLFPLGTNGECFKFPIEERKKIAELVVKTVDHSKTKVYIQTASMSLEETLELSRHAQEIGADGIGVMTPQFFRLDEREIEEYYTKVSKSVNVDFPVYLYNIPQCTGNDITAALAQRLSEKNENIVGIKYSFSNMIRTLEYLQIKNFSVLHGDDILELQMLTMGCDGIVSGLSGVYPEPYVNIYKAWIAGDIAEAMKWQKILYKLTKALGFGRVTLMRKALEKRGFEIGDAKLPSLTPTDKELEKMYSELAQVDAFIKAMQNPAQD